MVFNLDLGLKFVEILYLISKLIIKMLKFFLLIRG